MIIYLLIVCCLFVSCMFSGIEAGILSINRIRLRHRAKTGEAAAIKLQRLLENPERLLVTVLCVTNFMNVCAFLLGTQALLLRFGPLAWLLSPLIALPVYVLGIELLPKSFFRRFPYRLLTPFAELLRLTGLCLSPLLALGRLLVKPLLPDRESGPRKLFAAREDFKYLTIESERAGAITSFERQMIHQVVDFRGVKVRDVMLPIERTISVPAGASTDDVLFLSHKHDIDRFPVLTRSGDLIGLVNVLELLLDRSGHGNISQHQRRLVTVTPTEPAYNAIRKLRAARTSLAAVVENGKPIGIVSSEELIARLVNTARR